MHAERATLGTPSRGDAATPAGSAPAPSRTRRIFAKAGLALGLSLIGTLAPGTAHADPLDDRLAAARVGAVKALEEAAAWAMNNRLLGARHRTLRSVLVLAPEHAMARAALEFTRDKPTGTWVPSKKYREPADWNKDALPAYDARVLSALTTYRNDAMVAVEEAGEAAGPRRGATLDQLAALLPDDAVVHQARGDVLLGRRWVMAETARAFERRRELKTLAREARKKSAPAEADAKLVAAGWSSAYRSADVVGAGTLDARTMSVAVDLAAACRPFFAGVFGLAEEPAGLSSFYLLRTEAEAESLFTLNGEAREWERLKAAGLGGGWLHRASFVTWGRDPRVSVQWVVRHALNALAKARFRHFERGWISEGVGRVLCWHFAEFYGGSLVSLDQTQIAPDAEDAGVSEPTGDRIAAARDALRTLPVHRLVALLTMRLTGMRVLDAILAYALGAYLIEGVPDKAAAFLDATVASDDGRKVVETTLGMTAEELLVRLRRWTEEMTAPR